MRGHIKKLIVIGLFIGLSFIGANIKILNSIAFDSMPAFLGALIYGPVAGIFIGGIGHILSASLSGFSLTIPLHIVIMIEMMICGGIYGLMREKVHPVLRIVIMTIINGPITLILTSYIAKLLKMPFSGITMFIALIIPLTIASFANVLIAEIIYPILKKHINFD